VIRWFVLDGGDGVLEFPDGFELYALTVNGVSCWCWWRGWTLLGFIRPGAAG
jgi:hypothetical protein